MQSARMSDYISAECRGTDQYSLWYSGQLYKKTVSGLSTKTKANIVIFFPSLINFKIYFFKFVQKQIPALQIMREVKFRKVKIE